MKIAGKTLCPAEVPISKKIVVYFADYQRKPKFVETTKTLIYFVFLNLEDGHQ